MSPQIRAQLKKVQLVGDPEIDKVFPGLQRTDVRITTTDGRLLTRQLDYPKGDSRNPLTDKEVEEKFAALAEDVLSVAAQKKLKTAVWNLDRVRMVTELMALTKATLPDRKGRQKRMATRPGRTRRAGD